MRYNMYLGEVIHSSPLGRAFIKKMRLWVGIPLWESETKSEQEGDFYGN